VTSPRSFVDDPAESDPDEGKSNVSMLEPPVKSHGKGGEATPLSKGQLPFPLYLSKTQKASLYVPGSMTRKEFELLKRQIEHSLSIMEATILADDDAPEN
jgi:hypothetical protein